MSVKITYFVHGTTTDNETWKATWRLPWELSELWIKQAKELPNQIWNQKFDAMFCSDLKRAIDSAYLGFEWSCPIIEDKRLRECNYWDFNGHKGKEFKPDITKFIDNPFTNWESYNNVKERISEFLKDIKEEYQWKHIAIMAHHAPQLALDVLLKNITMEEAIKTDRRKTRSRKPGREYILQ